MHFKVIDYLSVELKQSKGLLTEILKSSKKNNPLEWKVKFTTSNKNRKKLNRLNKKYKLKKDNLTNCKKLKINSLKLYQDFKLIKKTLNKKIKTLSKEKCISFKMYKRKEKRNKKSYC